MKFSILIKAAKGRTVLSSIILTQTSAAHNMSTWQFLMNLKLWQFFCQGVSAQPLSFFISTSFSACFSYPNPPSPKDFTDCKNREDFGLSDLNVYFTVPMQTLEMNFYY